MNTVQLKALVASYLRSVLSAAVALYLAGATEPRVLAWSLLAAVLPVVLRAVNPKDKAFGIVPSAKVVEEALKAAKPTKAPAKKTNAPKTAVKKTTTKK